MTSSGNSPPVANIVWDKSRLHGDHHHHHHHEHPHHHQHPHHKAPALRPSSAGEVTRRPHPMPPSLPGRPRPAKSELRMSFDPMKDLHMWTMWRVAVNGRIVDETRRRKLTAPSQENRDPPPNPYLVKTPLNRFIRVDNGSRNIAGVLMDPHGEGGGSLGTQQFVYYGVPRVVLKKKNKVVHLPK